MPKLIITRGLPGSGKTTWAKGLMKGNRTIGRANRDDIRRTVFSDVSSPMGYRFNKQQEKLVTNIQDRIIGMLLGAKRHVIVDDTTIPWARHQRFDALAMRYGAELLVVNFDEKVATCIARQEGRPASEVVPMDVIMRMDESRSKANEDDWKASGNLVSMDACVKLLTAGA